MVNKLLDEYECPFDIYMFKFINMHLDMYYKLGFTPNMVTTLSIIFGLLAAYEIIYGNFIFAAFLVLVSYYLDCVDGKLARKYNMVSQLGDYYDHFGDLFGANLNRKDIVQFTGDTELLSAESVHVSKEKERVEKHIINANTIDTLMQVEELANKYELNTIFKTKKDILNGK